MSGRVSRTNALEGLPPLLIHLIHALREKGPEGHADAVTALGRYALIAVPQRGVFAPHDPDDYVTIERIAVQHLDLTRGKRAFADAMKILATFEERDAIEAANSQLQDLFDEAYYYVGLAFGVTLAALAEPH